MPVPRPPRPPIRALTLHRPWPGLILHAGKDVENRRHQISWRGWVALHAGMVVDPAATGLTDALGVAPELAEDLTLGFVGFVRLDSCHPCRATPAAGACLGACSVWADPTPGRWHWVLTDPRPLPEPINVRGQQGLWIPPPEVLAAARQLIPEEVW